MARPVAVKDDGFENLSDVFAQTFGYVDSAEVVFVDLVGYKFVGHTGLVEQAGDVCFQFVFAHGLWGFG